MSKTSPSFIIGVAGGSGSGKSTVVAKLREALKGTSTLVIQHDDYYRNQSHLPMEQRVLTNYDHPDSLESELLVTHLQQLKAGKAVEHPVYDFVNHTRSSETVRLEPARVIIVEGILIFASQELRQEFALKVFVDTDDDIRFIRRLERDIEERGRTMESVIEQYQTTVRPMYQQFVWPSKRFADVIIPEGGFNQVALDVLLARVREIHKKS